ncbi:MAG: glutamate--cysteine ligase [Gallionellaceae bacterium]|nr:glutamate--cysteine ligase [Gallionellaceae bacterium]
MGQEIARSHFSEADFQRFHGQLRDETDALTRDCAAGRFSDPRFVVGFELEAWLIDHAGFPNPVNTALLERLHDPLVVPELSRFNIELNGPPASMRSGVLNALEQGLTGTWNKCQATAHGMDAALVMIGILPNIRADDLTLANMSAMKRYRVLNEQVLKQRQGAALHIHIQGEESLESHLPDVMLEAATTSFQVHLQVPFARAARYYNAALIACAPLMAASGNSPLLFGKRLWRETRIPLFEQSVELGGYGGLADPGVRRVSFGQGYVLGSLLELFRENLDLFPVLLPMPLDEPAERYPHLRQHNGSIWRWVRPLVGFDETGQAHVRLEQRIFPSGPTLLDMVANCACHFGLSRALAEASEVPETRLPFAAARANFYAAARDGLAAKLLWLDGEHYPARDFWPRIGLPLAEQGLRDFGLESVEIERYLGIVEARVRRGQTGAAWQLAHLDKQGGKAHEAAVAAMLADYLENQRSGAPVHEWSV